MGAVRTVALEGYGLLTVAGAAARRSVSERTVQRWVESGGICVALLGTARNKVYLIPIKELDAYVPAPAGAPAGNQFAKKTDAKKPAKQSTRKKSGKNTAKG